MEVNLYCFDYVKLTTQIMQKPINLMPPPRNIGKNFKMSLEQCSSI